MSPLLRLDIQFVNACCNVLRQTGGAEDRWKYQPLFLGLEEDIA
jgi:hypothetical protein